MKYLILLTPLTSYFFGGRQTFRNYYIARSRRWPQQTHLLGMVRRVLQEEEDLLKLRDVGWRLCRSGKKKSRIAALLGSYDHGGEHEGLGVIERLSPVFLASLDDRGVQDFHFQAPLDCLHELIDTPADDGPLLRLGGRWREEGAAELGEYDPKKGLPDKLTTTAFWRDYLDEEVPSADHLLEADQVFLKEERIGNKRQDRVVREDEEGSLYKLYSYRLRTRREKRKDGDPPQLDRDFRFAFQLELKGEDDVLKKDWLKPGFSRMVYLGAERSAFHLQIKAWDKAWDEWLPSGGSGNVKAVALSEVQLPEDWESQLQPRMVLSGSPTSFSRFVPDRNKEDRYQPTLHGRRELLPKGAVIRTGSRLEKLDPFMEAIGYNHLIYT
jgi:hypothetical protein